MRHPEYPLFTQSCSINESVGLLPAGYHHLALLQRQQQQLERQQRGHLQHPVVLQYPLLQHSLSSTDNASTKHSVTLYFGGGFPRYSSSSPHPRVDIDIHEGERRCNFRSEDVPYLGLLREVAPAVRSAG